MIVRLRTTARHAGIALLVLAAGPLLPAGVLAGGTAADPVAALPGATEPASLAGYDVYFGELHAHCEFSDGTGSAAGAYWSGRAAGLDFFTLSDHHNMIAPWEWAATQAAADAADEPGAFVALAAYEFGWWYHINVFAPPCLLRPPDTQGGGRETVAADEDVVAALPGAMGMFNHPTWSETGDFDDFAGLTPERDAAMELIEVYNHGDGAAEWYEPSYVKCLDAGWHVMPTAVGDTHYVDWDTEVMPYEMRTALLAPELTRAALYDAVRSHRGYATLDPDLRISFTVNGAVMGSRVARTARVLVGVQVDDPDVMVAGDAIERLDLVGAGGSVLASAEVSGHKVAWSVVLRRPASDWVYLRVTTGDGATAWTAPVWLED